MSGSQSNQVLPSTTGQLLVVIAEAWGSDGGVLQRFTRLGPGCAWLPVGAPIPVSLGRFGLAWGLGVHPPLAGMVPIKREGDGRAPAGIFAIPALFGAAALASDLAQGAKLPYLQATPDLKAIDDPASVYYNRIVDQSAITQPDWVSCEDMLRSDQRYAIGAVIAHNTELPVPGAGSCIFMHVWESKGV